MKVENDVNLTSIEKDLCNFYDFCKENGLTPSEMREICKPLYGLVRKQRIVKYVRYALFFTLILTVGCVLMTFEPVEWHLSAIGRILLVKMLPFWNWPRLANAKCLVNNFETTRDYNEFNCNFCESHKFVPNFNAVNATDVIAIYLDVHSPIIVTEGLTEWFPMVNVNNFTDIIASDPRFTKFHPCQLNSNVAHTNTNFKTLISRTTLFPSFFYHFQNCEFASVKVFREYAPKLHWFPLSFAPIQYSWLIESKNYVSTIYKKVRLIEKVAVFAQLIGSTQILLEARRNCASECSDIELTLYEGNILIVGSLYDVYYKPGIQTHNLAIILETN